MGVFAIGWSAYHAAGCDGLVRRHVVVMRKRDKGECRWPHEQASTKRHLRVRTAPSRPRQSRRPPAARRLPAHNVAIDYPPKNARMRVHACAYVRVSADRWVCGVDTDLCGACGPKYAKKGGWSGPSECDDVIRRARISRSRGPPHREVTDGLRQPPV